MSEPLSAARPDFFGKDSCVPFIGVVEDVDDPKHSGRVKVRCVGWHPKERKGGEDALSTEDIPWSRVGMPVTHAQQSRIGGKHGLLPGCWVFGFFLDGDEAQDPFVVSSFNFTSKASDKDNRKDVAGETGTLSEQAEGFDKVLSSPSTQPNNALRTDEEKQQKGFSSGADKAGDNVNNDSDNDKCGGKAELAAAAENAQRAEFKNPENTVGNIYEVDFADGRCGGNAHAQEDIQRKMQERMPSQYNRFTYGDVVWDRFSGNYIDLNGLLAQLALDICALLKQLVEAIKAEMEEKQFRQTKGAMIVTVPGRNPELRIKMDEQQKRTSDIFHALIAMIIDQLCMLIFDLLKNQQNGGEPGSGGGGGGGLPNPTTPIFNPGDPCVADTFIKNFEITIRKGIDDAYTESNNLINESNNKNSDGGSSLDNILGMIGGLIGVVSGSGMLFPLSEKYTEKPQIHNSQGNKTQDKRTREGCRQERTYNTAEGAAGAMGFMQAMAGGGGGGESSSSSSSSYNGSSVTRPSDLDDMRKAWLQWGIDRSETLQDLTVDYTTCEGGETPQFPDPGPGNPNLPPPTTTVPDKPDNGIKKPKPDKPISPPPPGDFVEVVPVPLPTVPPFSEGPENGTPVKIVIENPGENYYNPDLGGGNPFPEIFIPGYDGTPIPVIDPDTGEFVDIITKPGDFDSNYPIPPISVIPGQSPNGISSKDPAYSIEIVGFFIQNTGFNYVCPELKVYDRDKESYSNGQFSVGVLEGRIVEVEIINSGSGFYRIPLVEITDPCSSEGYGAKIYPIMGVFPRAYSKASLPQEVLELIYCPGKNQKNLVTRRRGDPIDTVTKIVKKSGNQLRIEADLPITEEVSLTVPVTNSGGY